MWRLQTLPERFPLRRCVRTQATSYPAAIIATEHHLQLSLSPALCLLRHAADNTGRFDPTGALSALEICLEQFQGKSSGEFSLWSMQCHQYSVQENEACSVRPLRIGRVLSLNFLLSSLDQAYCTSIARLPVLTPLESGFVPAAPQAT